MPQARRGSSSTQSGGTPAAPRATRAAAKPRASRAAAKPAAAKPAAAKASAAKPAAKPATTRAAAKPAARKAAATAKPAAAKPAARRPAAANPAAAKPAADARRDAVAERVRKLNERIIEAAHDAGENTLTTYEKALKAIASGIEKGPGRSDIDWISSLATAQAKFIRDLTDSWTKAARDMLPK
jgi:chemotaxis protein histidine kinase CheA